MFCQIVVPHIETDHDPQGVLLRLLASMVHHSCWMLGVIQKQTTLLLAQNLSSAVLSFRISKRSILQWS